jgi:hypothetical protein
LTNKNRDLIMSLPAARCSWCRTGRAVQCALEEAGSRARDVGEPNRYGQIAEVCGESRPEAIHLPVRKRAYCDKAAGEIAFSIKAPRWAKEKKQIAREGVRGAKGTPSYPPRVGHAQNPREILRCAQNDTNLAWQPVAKLVPRDSAAANSAGVHTSRCAQNDTRARLSMCYKGFGPTRRIGVWGTRRTNFRACSG